MQVQAQRSEITAERDEATEGRDGAILWERIQGATTTELADRYQLSTEGVRQIVIRETRAHISDLLHTLWLLQASFEALEVTVPGDTPAESLSYVNWMLREMDRQLGVRPHVAYRASEGGQLVIALSHPDFDPDFDPDRPGGDQ